MCVPLKVEENYNGGGITESLPLKCIFLTAWLPWFFAQMRKPPLKSPPDHPYPVGLARFYPSTSGWSRGSGIFIEQPVALRRVGATERNLCPVKVLIAVNAANSGQPEIFVQHLSAAVLEMLRPIAYPGGVGREILEAGDFAGRIPRPIDKDNRMAAPVIAAEIQEIAGLGIL